VSLIAYYPSHVQQQNPYFELYHRALAAHGVDVCPGTVNDSFLRANVGRVAAMHIQWAPEHIWRIYGKGWFAQMRGVGGLWRYLRLGRRLGVKLLWTIHDLEHLDGANWIDRRGYGLLARHADLCICHSEWCRAEVIRRHGLPPEKVLSIPHGNYDGQYPNPRPRPQVLADWGLAPDKRTLLCFGQIRPYKGLDLALKAMTRLDAQYQLVIAGNPMVAEHAQQLQDLARNLDGAHVAARTLSDQDIADLMNAADCVLFPYRKITGSGALAAAQTFSRGVVVADLPYFREVLAPEPKAGEFFPVGDASALAETVRRFFATPLEERQAASRRLADCYAWHKVVMPVVEWMRENLPQRKLREAALAS
jgi:glycosyltransferase involved in cell wall biosynthesis